MIPRTRNANHAANAAASGTGSTEVGGAAIQRAFAIAKVKLIMSVSNPGLQPSASQCRRHHRLAKAVTKLASRYDQ